MNDDKNTLDLNSLTNYETYEIKEAVSTINFCDVAALSNCQKVTSSTNALKGGQLKLESFQIFKKVK